MYPEPVVSPDGPPPVDPVEMLVGRRSAPRVPVELPAKFRIGERELDVLVSDVSESGARLEMDSPPPSGIHGVLMWEDVACVCRVVWSASDAFGVQFHAQG